VAAGPGSTGLQVVDLPISTDLVSAIVASVAGSFFGN
jgi:hypothetical protein